MRVRFEDHAGFQRAALGAAVACSAVAAAGVLAGSTILSPGVAVLGAAVATLALAAGHARLVLDPVGDAVARAAATADAAGRALLARASGARAGILAAARRAPGAGRALAAAAAEATRELAELHRRRQLLARAAADARSADAGSGAKALETLAAGAADPVLRETYARAADAMAEREARLHALEGLVARIDARVIAAVAELETAALASATRHDAPAAEPEAALTRPCERLRAATADLAAEREAFAELAAL